MPTMVAPVRGSLAGIPVTVPSDKKEERPQEARPKVREPEHRVAPSVLRTRDP